jgi:Ca2+-binding EF-hand superfamily protein
MDETITQQESNSIYAMLDRDKSGKVDKKEFEKFFAVDESQSLLTSKVENMRWAIHIFHEINHKIQDRG